MTLKSSSPVADALLATTDWIVVVGNAFNGGLFAVGPFPTEEKALAWFDENGGSEVAAAAPCLDPKKTCLDRLGFPLHLDDAARS